MERRLRRHREEPHQQPLLVGAVEGGTVEIGAGDADDPLMDGGGVVNVIWGAFTDAMTAVGMTVGEVRTLLQRMHGIPAHALMTLNGAEVDGTRRLAPGDTLEFVRDAGEKGAR